MLRGTSIRPLLSRPTDSIAALTPMFGIRIRRGSIPGKGGNGVAVGGSGVAVGVAGTVEGAAVRVGARVGAGVAGAVGSGNGVAVGSGVPVGARATLIVTGWTSCGRATVPIALAGVSTKKIRAARITIAIAPIVAGPIFWNKLGCLVRLLKVLLWINRSKNSNG